MVRPTPADRIRSSGTFVRQRLESKPKSKSATRYRRWFGNSKTDGHATVWRLALGDLMLRNSKPDEPFNLQRFVEAQESIFDQICSELREGRKSSHWMWFIFPQIAGLGFSHFATKYAISSLDEARAYRRHPILGSRLQLCTSLVNAIEGRAIHEIFEDPDDMKFRSSMTLFAQVLPGNEVFKEALRKYFGDVPDSLTLELLSKSA